MMYEYCVYTLLICFLYSITVSENNFLLNNMPSEKKRGTSSSDNDARGKKIISYSSNWFDKKIAPAKKISQLLSILEIASNIFTEDLVKMSLGVNPKQSIYEYYSSKVSGKQLIFYSISIVKSMNSVFSLMRDLLIFQNDLEDLSVKFEGLKPGQLFNEKMFGLTDNIFSLNTGNLYALCRVIGAQLEDAKLKQEWVNAISEIGNNKAMLKKLFGDTKHGQAMKGIFILLLRILQEADKYIIPFVTADKISVFRFIKHIDDAYKDDEDWKKIKGKFSKNIKVLKESQELQKVVTSYDKMLYDWFENIDSMCKNIEYVDHFYSHLESFARIKKGDNLSIMEWQMKMLEIMHSKHLLSHERVEEVLIFYNSIYKIYDPQCISGFISILKRSSEDNKHIMSIAQMVLRIWHGEKGDVNDINEYINALDTDTKKQLQNDVGLFFAHDVRRRDDLLRPCFSEESEEQHEIERQQEQQQEIRQPEKQELEKPEEPEEPEEQQELEKQELETQIEKPEEQQEQEQKKKEIKEKECEQYFLQIISNSPNVLRNVILQKYKENQERYDAFKASVYEDYPSIERIMKQQKGSEEVMKECFEGLQKAHNLGKKINVIQAFIEKIIALFRPNKAEKDREKAMKNFVDLFTEKVECSRSQNPQSRK